MRRRWMLTGVWMLSTLAATLVAWGAVRLVADQVSPGTVASLPTAVALAEADLAGGDPAAAPRARASQRPRPTRTDTAPVRPAQPGGDDPARPADDPAVDQPARQQPDSSGEGDQDPEPVATTQAYDLVGGVVTVRYQGTSTRVVEASPNSGFVVEVNDGGPDTVDVRFRSDDHESRFVTRIHDGSPDPQREERPR